MKKVLIASSILFVPVFTVLAQEGESKALITNIAEGTEQELEEFYDEITENANTENKELAEAEQEELEDR